MSRPTLAFNRSDRDRVAGDRMAYLLGEIDALLAACSQEERTAFLEECDQIKAKYRKPPELPGFLIKKREMPPTLRATPPEELPRSDLPDFLAQRRFPTKLWDSPELPDFLSKSN